MCKCLCIYIYIYICIAYLFINLFVCLCIALSIDLSKIPLAHVYTPAPHWPPKLRAGPRLPRAQLCVSQRANAWGGRE